jgi:DNA-directed RNA polymerase I, II, and III subunit RPABC5
MIIPIKCFTCGNVLANKYRYYCDEVRKQKLESNQNEKVLYFDKNFNKKSIEGIVLDEMKLNKYCCRRHMLTHVDID